MKPNSLTVKFKFKTQKPKYFGEKSQMTSTVLQLK